MVAPQLNSVLREGHLKADHREVVCGQRDKGGEGEEVGEEMRTGLE